MSGVGSVVVVSCADPWAAAHGGTVRTRSIVRAAAAAGADVVCVYPDQGGTVPSDSAPTHWRPYRSDSLGSQSLPSWTRRIKRAVLPLPTAIGTRSPRLEAELRALDVGPSTTVISSRLPEAVLAQRLGARSWVDHADLWSKMAVREEQARRGPASWIAAAQARLVGRRERQVVLAADTNTAAGFDDAASLELELGARHVSWLPNPVERGPAGPANGTWRRGGFLANFEFWPNLDAFAALADHWLGPLRSAGKRVVVAGYGAERLPAVNGIDNLGEVDDIGEFYDAVDFTVAPIRLGGGMKVKVIESLRWGRPVLATHFALEGFSPQVRGLAVHAGLASLDPTRVDDLLSASLDALRNDPTALDVFDSERFDASIAAVLARQREP